MAVKYFGANNILETSLHFAAFVHESDTRNIVSMGKKQNASLQRCNAYSREFLFILRGEKEGRAPFFEIVT
jgi:hypothetical protein